MFLLAAGTTPPAQTISVCALAANPRRFIGKQVLVVGDLTDIMPHGVILSGGPKSDCVVEVGKVADPRSPDVLDVIHGSPQTAGVAVPTVAHVRIKGVLRSQRSRDFYGRSYRAYVLDEMVISYQTDLR